MGEIYIQSYNKWKISRTDEIQESLNSEIFINTKHDKLASHI